jgi:hypothetical protein
MHGGAYVMWESIWVVDVMTSQNVTKLQCFDTARLFQEA